jgi:H+/Cl- antiporter ClcA
MPLNKSLFERMIKWIFLSSLVGILGGLSSSLFLTLLNWASSLRILNPFLIWFLPIAGLLTAIIYHRFGSEAVKGTGLIFEEIHNPKKTLPIAIIPLVLIGTILTHLTGGSAGREGTAVQMSATLADRVSKFFRFHNKGGRIVLLMAGISAGFGSALGTPFAGAIFGMEVISGFKNRYRVFPMCLTASYVAFAVTRLLNIPHSHFLKITAPSFNFSVFISLIISGIIFGLMAFLFFLPSLAEFFFAYFIT